MPPADAAIPPDNHAGRGSPAPLSGLAALSQTVPPDESAELIQPASGGGYTADVIRAGLAAGLDAVGVAPAEPMLRARDAIRDRVARGFDAGMQFTFRNPERSTDPARAVRGARSMVVGARWYGSADDPPVPAGHGRFARYARGDHYGALRDALGSVRDRLRADGHLAVAFADDNSLVDREAAHLAGLGWFGKNAQILVRGLGSWVILGAVVTSADLDPSPAPVEDGCGACRRCIDACPTGAIVEPGVVDATRCLSWLAQRPGPFDPRYREALGDRLYGCDDCQEPCPPARVAVARRQGAPVAASASVDVVALLEGSDDDVLAAMGRAYVADRNPDWVRRNALIVLGNSGVRDRRSLDAAHRYEHHANPVLREQARWTLDRLGAPAGCKD